ncbi:hypothetical protein SAMN05421678_115117 [Actinopolymorpha cephalotaxi]|uniref:Photosystem II stability/assembly factor-like uncharacterized protein n=1 Tax=Actinopolymorpha cephalotaxi TaxID=504797 RepID=A0A1I2Z075_9ACTN|nr:hypothetical protein [Actinopolymorpha cephalotaxi]NYH81799.1 photosystem II stability/assembly factor-like uncharacterized protein [Actinopolymorpha cephalotaxi]SFH31282.1 hypothetical protein SAMN05421678_115117 [Actinopolymorpha cephalotaxi]
MGEPASPILSAAAGPRPGELWLGGVGGVVSTGTSGEAGASGASGGAAAGVNGPLTCVAALGTVAGRLLAGGAEGIARRGAGGWDLAQVQGSGAPVVAFLDVRMPGADVDPAGPGESREDREDHDGDVVLAATLGDGVLRSADGGRTWEPVFGLADIEVTALARTPCGRLLAGTPEGVFASENAGRAWRPAGHDPGHDLPGSDEQVAAFAVAAFAVAADGTVVAGLESGDLWGSADDGRTWAPIGSLPAPVTALVATSAGTLLAGTSGAGVWRSAGGAGWYETAPEKPAGTVYCLLADGTTTYAGTDTGLLVSRDDGRTWSEVGVPSTADLDRMVWWDDRPLLAGPRSGIVRPAAAPNEWQSLPGVPFPLLGLGVAPDGALLASGPDGLFRRTPADADWTPVVEGSVGEVGRLAFAADGRGWAAPARHGDTLLHSADAGRTWSRHPAPFGTFPLAALGWAGQDALVAATFDHRRNLVTVFDSGDGGRTWRTQLTAETAWPDVHVARAGADGPAVLGIGRLVLRRDGDGGWEHLATFETGVRAMTGTPTGLAVLTGDGLWSYDLPTSTGSGSGPAPGPGTSRVTGTDGTDGTDDTGWRRVEDAPDPASAYDLAGRGDELLVLLAGGGVWTSIPTRRGR